jgi:hypothetical protein
MKTILLGLLLLASPLLLVSCGGEDEGKKQALEEVAAYIEAQPQPGVFEPGGFILPEGKQDCLIPTKPSPRSVLHATCDWKVEDAGDGWVVRITETWECDEFNALIGNSDFCVQETGSRTWNYTVTADGIVTLVVEQGDSPPEGFLEGALAEATPTIAPTP